MKQTITIDQLNELSPEGKEKLREWWEPQEGDKYALYSKRWNKYYTQYPVSFLETEGDWETEGIAPYQKGNQDYPLLSIGRMIEFLEENSPDKGGHSLISFPIADKDDKKRSAAYGYNCSYDDCDWIEKPELCDALWEAVKEVLNG